MMIAKQNAFASLAAIAAALSLTSAPAAAVDLPAVTTGDVAVVTGAAGEANQHRWRGRHYDDYYYDDDDIDAGDVIAGVAVIGAIAAIAGVFDGDDDDRGDDGDYRDYRDGDYRERDRRDDRRGSYDGTGLERAADMCVAQVERGSDRVEEVSEARRTVDGWRVAGTLDNGDSWNCWIDNEGRLRNVDIGAAGYSANDGDPRYPSAAGGEQWDDSAYASARANVRTPAQGAYSYRDAPAADGPQPAYPGGPLPGEEDPYANAPEWQGDGRYSTAEAPDFAQAGN